MSKTIKAPRKKVRDHLIESGLSKRGSGKHKLEKDKRKQNKLKKLIEEQSE